MICVRKGQSVNKDYCQHSCQSILSCRQSRFPSSIQQHHRSTSGECNLKHLSQPMVIAVTAESLVYHKIVRFQKSCLDYLMMDMLLQNANLST